MKKQIYLTDKIQSLDRDDLLLSQLDKLVKNKAWKCKILLRTILMVDKKDHSQYFKKTFELIKQMLKAGICEDLRSSKHTSNGKEMWHNVKFGLAYYILTRKLTTEEDEIMYKLFTTYISADVQKEILDE